VRQKKPIPAAIACAPHLTPRFSIKRRRRGFARAPAAFVCGKYGVLEA